MPGQKEVTTQKKESHTLKGHDLASASSCSYASRQLVSSSVCFQNWDLELSGSTDKIYFDWNHTEKVTTCEDICCGIRGRRRSKSERRCANAWLRFWGGARHAMVQGADHTQKPKCSRPIQKWTKRWSWSRQLGCEPVRPPTCHSQQPSP